MQNNSTTPPSQTLALERFAFITPIHELVRQGFPLAVALEQVSLRPLTLADGTQRLRARRTIEDGGYDYQQGGFAARSPTVRADQGQPRTLTAPQQKWIWEPAQTPLAVPVKVRYRRWREPDPQLPALNSIDRFLREHQLNTQTRRQPLRQPLGGAPQCFEAPFVNDRWMTDFFPRPLPAPRLGRQSPAHLPVCPHRRPLAPHSVGGRLPAGRPPGLPSHAQRSPAPPRLARPALPRPGRTLHQ